MSELNWQRPANVVLSSGHAAFLDPEVNKAIKKVLNEWGKYLEVNESHNALNVALKYTDDSCDSLQNQQRLWEITNSGGLAKRAEAILWKLPMLHTRLP